MQESTTSPLVRARSPRVRRRDEGRTGALLAAPSIVGLALFVALPMLLVVALCFVRWDLVAPPRFAGLGEIATTLLDPTTWSSIAVTALLTAVVVPVETLAGLGVAALIAPRRARGAIATVLALPWAAAPATIGLVWQWLLAPVGGAAEALTGVQPSWTATPAGALATVAGVLVWSQTGYLAMFYLNALLSVPRDLLDAAALDGASAAQRFRSIAVPVIRPTTVFVVLVSAAQTASVFDVVTTLTGGGPGTSTTVVALRIYQAAFAQFDLGRSAVLTVLTLGGLGLVLLAARRLDGSRARRA